MTILTPLLYKVLTQSFFRKVAVHRKLNISTTTQSSRCQEEFSHGTQQSFMWEGSTRRCNPSLFKSILNTIFDRKGTPFVYLPLTNGTPLTDLAQNVSSPLTAVNSLSLKYQKITKPRNFLDFSRKSSISLCRVFYQRKNRFPYPFIYLRLEKGTPFEMYGRSLPFQAIIGSIPFPGPRCPKA